MDNNIKTKLNDFIQEYLVERKAMFIPIACVSTFMLVGYAAVDKEKPEIVSNKIELPYGEELDVNTIEVTDNRDDRDLISVEVVDASLNTSQLGTYDVEVKATDQFSNETTKVIKVEVVDQAGPAFEVLGANEGYVVQVPVNGSNDFASYVKAEDNVDGDVTPFIEADGQLDTSKIGFQTVTLKVSDSSGNTTKETYEFAVSDMEAPTIALTNGENPEVDYGSEFNVDSIATITDNFDEAVNVTVEGEVDTKKEETQTIKITAKDAAGNTSEQTVNVNVKDLTGPEIVLSKTSITVEAGEAVNGAEYLTSATDNKDGDVKGKVEIGSVDTSKSGTKSLTYTVSDEAGNTSEAILTVKVNAAASEAGGNPDGSVVGGSALSYAISKVGSPYVYGAAGPNAFDCSGLMYWSFKQAGVNIPRTSGGQASGGTYVDRANLQPGDLVFFSAYSGGGISHVGMYVGGGMMVHAGTPSTGVCYSSINIMSYVTARRY
ncbi:MAG: NlpC/P60 family protein [Coprobacillaceae bacterium]